jgi:hypothetical protein
LRVNYSPHFQRMSTAMTALYKQQMKYYYLLVYIITPSYNSTLYIYL